MFQERLYIRFIQIRFSVTIGAEEIIKLNERKKKEKSGRLFWRKFLNMKQNTQKVPIQLAENLAVSNIDFRGHSLMTLRG